jgi:hypothetical protein
MRPITTTLSTGLALVLALVLGCTATPNPSAPTLNPTTGTHPAGWLNVHWSAYLQNRDQCATCHGSATDMTVPPTAVNAPSCFNTTTGCHHVGPNGGPNHPDGWATVGSINPPPHGLAAIAAAPSDFNVAAPASFPMQGFVTCTPCHGGSYTNPVGFAPSCATAGCHTDVTTNLNAPTVQSPHPQGRWNAGLGKNSTHVNHDLVDATNVTQCAICHTAGANCKDLVAPKAAGVPGCFNGTLCHSTSFVLSPSSTALRPTVLTQN